MENISLEENERIDDLEFKNLKIIQNKNGFCFGIDAVLLSDFAKKIKKKAVVLDIGSGTGIISILLCKKTELDKIYGIEIQEEVAKMSKKSAELNGLEDKFKVINIDINEIFTVFEKNKFDVIVTNPPYKQINTGAQNTEIKKLISRHEIKCTLEDVIEKSSKLLKSLGEFYMVHRVERLVDIMCLLRKYNLEPKQIRFVQSKINEKPKLILIKAIKNAKPFLKIDSPLIIYREDGEYTDEILKIYSKKRE